MESNSIKLKLTLLVVSYDKSKDLRDLTSYKFLLNEKSEPISVTTNTLSDGSHDSLLQKLFEQYIHYDYDYVYKLLVAARSKDNLIELCYLASMPYILGFNKSGKLFTLEDFSNEIIKLENFYEKLYEQNGARSFR